MPGITSSKQLFSSLKMQLSLDRAVTVGTSESGSGPLVNDHEFSVVATRTIRTLEEIQVRNPRGSNAGFEPRIDGFGRTDNGFVRVDASKVFSELDEVDGAVV